jgi:hypothetical protein
MSAVPEAVQRKHVDRLDGSSTIYGMDYKTAGHLPLDDNEGWKTSCRNKMLAK